MNEPKLVYKRSSHGGVYAPGAAELLRMATHPNWNAIWRLMNAFASGETQKQHARVEPIAVLSEVYYMLAQIDQERRAALLKLPTK